MQCEVRDAPRVIDYTRSGIRNDQAGRMTRNRALEAFLAKYSPEIAEQVGTARAHLAKLFPRGFELVYDNYNALAIGYSPSERAGAAIVSIAVYPKWVTLFFLQGASLPDPQGILEGKGARVRSVRLLPASRLHDPAVQALLAAARATAADAFDQAPRLSTVIKSVSAKQRPRKPAAAIRKNVPTRKKPKS
jgi:hypothetical protein